MALPRFTETTKSAIRTLAHIDDAAMDELNKFVASNLEKLLSPDETYKECASVKKSSPEEAFTILNSIVPFIFNRMSMVTDATSEVSDLVQAVSGKQGDPKWTKNNDKKLKANISLLLENPKTRLKAKSIRLMTTHGNQFDECEVLSDIRPVFSADGKLKAEASVICHTLRVSYTGDDSKDFYVALNVKDLRELKKAVERALEKEVILGQLVSKAGMEYVKVT